MRKKIFTILIFVAFTQAYAQWTDNGANMTTGDNVGIGIGSAISKLHVVIQEDAISWPAVINNTQNSSTVSGYGIGIKLKHGWNHEGWKWGGIASVQENPWANHSGLAFYANETEYMRIKSNGNVGIGTTSPDMKLTVNGNIHAKEVKIDLNIPAPDYVFKEDYKLRSIEEVANFIKENSHLPEIPSAKEFEQNGV
ncbi:tail fiber protein, partial [Aquimarina sp. I32.4]|uniref:tail fiber protein n=1 Tax=Aquimarina sp. I32.4 TaxID=2053903 RepID=UPI000CDE9EC4